MTPMVFRAHAMISTARFFRRSFLAVTLLLVATAARCFAAGEATIPEIIPAKTTLHFHLAQQISSNKSRSGQPFRFVMIEPVVVNGKTILAAGGIGDGTLVLAGHAGTAGHEGDLTLRLDSIMTVDKRQLYFADQQLQINGHNDKIMSAALGFVPFVGIGAHFIRGQNVVITTDQAIVTVLQRDASTRCP